MHINNYEEINSNYLYTDELSSSKKETYINNAGTKQLSVTINMSYDYDHNGRKINAWEEINGNKILLSHLIYNELGQLIDKSLHSVNQGASYIQSMDYRYNSRGWLTSINNAALSNDGIKNNDSNDAFGEELVYDDYSVAALKQYNGNVSAVSWQAKMPAGGAGQLSQSFEYTYDRINRLSKANYTTTGNVGQFNEVLSYDVMGNIKTLQRYKSSASTPTDNLTYLYENGNNSSRLLSVTDASGSDTGQPNGLATYENDLNGNLKSDSKKLLNFTYNHLNLPYTITKTGTGAGNITFIYDAGGKKIRKLLAGTNRDYVSDIEYNNNGSIEFINTEEGRARPNGLSYFYDYSLKDHLGNSRVLIGQDGIINEQTDYYAFGLQMSRGVNIVPNPENKYKFNGKELENAFELNHYDYGARFYDPAVGRFISFDPMAEVSRKWSTHAYSYNNPVRFVDKDGMIPGDFLDETGKKIGSDGKDDGKLYVIKTTKSNFDSGAPSNGISKNDKNATEKFIKENNGKTSAFEANKIAYLNSVEIEGNAAGRQDMVNIVNQDNGKGGTSDANNREYGGAIRSDGRAEELNCGPVADPTIDASAHIDLPAYETRSTFHSHPSGTKFVSSVTKNESAGSSTTIGGTTTSGDFGNAPSNANGDVGNSGSKVNYVFSRGNGTVYIYNNTGVIATIPQAYFVTPKQEKK